jgi:phenylacetate-coenzyme A ligase PaaK-like adenylate-forming protein
MYWEKEVETMDRSKLEAAQLVALQDTLIKAEKSYYYGKTFQEKGIGVSSVNYQVSVYDQG